MFELLSQDGLRPFLISGAFVFALLVLEMVLMMLGLSSGGETDGPALDGPDAGPDLGGMDAADIATEFDVDPGIAANIEAAVAGQDFDLASDAVAADGPVSAPSVSGGLLDFLGMRSLPLNVWLALMSACFAAAGMSCQVILFTLLGFMLPVWLMIPLAAAAAIAMTRVLGRVIARLIPREETSAISRRSLGRRRGVITVGVARRGVPAEVRVRDGYGNDHYLMVEPLADDEEIPEGAAVLVLRLRNGTFRLVRVD